MRHGPWSPRDYGCRNDRIVWPGKSPMLSIDVCHRVSAISPRRNDPARDELPLLRDRQSKRRCDQRIIILMSYHQDTFRP